MDDPNLRHADAPRVLRWVFVRGEDTMTCELALDEFTLAYEFRTWSGSAPTSVTVERFLEVTRAFGRQCEWEAALIGQGWSLHAYESHTVDVIG
jgi:hypothetical protein